MTDGIAERIKREENAQKNCCNGTVEGMLRDCECAGTSGAYRFKDIADEYSSSETGRHAESLIVLKYMAYRPW
jgi:hypothetical protein